MRLHDGDIITFGGPKIVQSTMDMLAAQCSNPHTYTVCELQSLLPAGLQPAQDGTQQLMPPAEDMLPVCSAPEDNAQHSPVLRASRAAHAQSAAPLQTLRAAEGLQQTSLQAEGSSLQYYTEHRASGLVRHSVGDAGPELGAPAIEAAPHADPSAAAHTGSPAAGLGPASPDAEGADTTEHPAQHASAGAALAHAPGNLSGSAQQAIEDTAPPGLAESAAPPDAQAAAGTCAAAGSLEGSSCPASAATAAAGCCDGVIDLTEVSNLGGPCPPGVRRFAGLNTGCACIT